MLGLNFSRYCWSRVNFQYITNRTFLSEAYRCTEVWNNRLNTPILQKVRLEELYNDLDKNLQQNEPVSAVDIDIFANSIKNDNYFDELKDVLHKYRLTKETCTTLDSTHYAVARNFVDAKKYSELYDVLNDRLNYGIFLDDFTANILLDDLINEKNFELAAKVASLLMLQENFDNAISANLALYSCIKYLQSLQPDIVQEVIEEKPAAVTTKKKKVEEIKIRVRYLRNEFFDDHFDLQDAKLLTGKTIAMISNHKNDQLSVNCQLLGWLFYKKFDKVNDVIKVISKEKTLFKETVQVIKMALELTHFKGDPKDLEACTAVLAELEALPTQDVSYDTAIQECIKQALLQQQEKDIHLHSQLFDEWANTRETILKDQLAKVEEARLLKEKEERIQTLKNLDDKIAFLENPDKVLLQIDSKRVFYRKKWFGKKKKPRAIDEGYIPPEVQSRRS